MRLLGVGLLFLLHLVLARQLGDESYGTFSFVITLLGILSIVVPLGFDTALMRFIPQYREKLDWSAMRAIVARAHHLTLVISFILASVIWWVSWFAPFSENVSASLRIAAVMLPITAFSALRRKALIGLQRHKSSVVGEEIMLPAITLALIYLFQITSATQALNAYLFASGMVLASGLMWIWRALPEEAKNKSPVYRDKAWFVVSIPLMLSGVSQVVLNRADVVLLGILSDMQAVGVYSVAARIATLTTFVMTALNTIGAPMVAAAYHGGRSQELYSILRKTAYWSAMGALPIIVVVSIFSSEIMEVFGSGFGEGSVVLLILMVGQFFNAATGLAGTALSMTGHEKIFLQLVTGMMIFNVVANILIIPHWGITGTAVIAAMSTAVLNLLMAVILLRILRIKFGEDNNG